jgi:hypothetical protein
MNRQALLAAALAVMTVGAPSLARADANADVAKFNTDQAAYNQALTALQKKGTDATAADFDSVAQLKRTLDADVQVGAKDYNNQLTPSATSSENPYGCWKPETGIKKVNGVDQICFVGGLFAIPFRAELSGKKDIYGGVSGDFFAGFNFSFPNNWYFTVLAYAGYLPTFSTASVQTANNTGSTSGTGGALDFGVGISMPVPLNISNQSKGLIGIVIGTDVTGSSNRYPYNGKPYISVLLGANF